MFLFYLLFNFCFTVKTFVTHITGKKWFTINKFLLKPSQWHSGSVQRGPETTPRQGLAMGLGVPSCVPHSL